MRWKWAAPTVSSCAVCGPSVQNAARQPWSWAVHQHSSCRLTQHHRLLQEPHWGFESATVTPDYVLCGILQRTSVCSFAVLNPGHSLVAGTGFQTLFTQFWSISWPPSYVLLRTPSLFARCHGVTAVPSHGRSSSLLLCTEPNRITFQHDLFE